MTQVFNVADDFSSGPYNVDILEGNEQDRFEIEDETYTAPNAPITPAPPTFILDGETIVLCPNATDNPLDPIPNINSGEYVICECVIFFPRSPWEFTCKNSFRSAAHSIIELELEMLVLRK